MDRKTKLLIYELEKNGRMSLTKLGKKLGVSHVAIKKRLENLLNRNIMKISPQFNTSKLGLKIAAINIEVESYEKLKKLTGIFKECPRTFFVASTTGKFNLLVLIYAEDMDTLRSVLDVCSIRTRKGVRKSEVSVGEIISPEFFPIKITRKDNRKITPCGLNCSKCERFHMNKCLGCSATVNYKGNL